jgi:hypothetical protein
LRELTPSSLISIGMPFGQRPLRIHVGPDNGEATVVDNATDHARAEMLRRVGLTDLLKPVEIR